jgi:hypothetical protein
MLTSSIPNGVLQGRGVVFVPAVCRPPELHVGQTLVLSSLQLGRYPRQAGQVLYWSCFEPQGHPALDGCTSMVGGSRSRRVVVRGHVTATPGSGREMGHQ